MACTETNLVYITQAKKQWLCRNCEPQSYNHRAHFFVCVRGPLSWCYGRTAALRLIVQPLWWRWAVFYQVFTINGAPVEGNRQEKTDNSEKNLSQCHFVHHKSHMDLTWDRTPGLRGKRPATNRLSHGTAKPNLVIILYETCLLSKSQTFIYRLSPSP
jgi:hypothetical protein